MGKRLKDGNGKWIAPRNLPGAAIALGQSIMRKATGRYPRQPWIPFAAAKALDGLLGRQDTVWEIGAGFSTLWLGDRVGQVISIEADKDWHERLSKIISDEKRSNIDLRYEWRAEQMATVSADNIDLLYIDGGPRDQCLANGWKNVRAGGLIYCDNTDDAEFWGKPGFRQCVDQIRQQIASVEFFSDYVPAMFAVNEGAIIRLK